MTKLRLSIALNPYEHALDALTGRVPVEGVELNWLRVADDDIAPRFARDRAFDIAEMPLFDYVARRAQGDDSVLALPVFLSRAFVQGAIWRRDGGTVATPGDLDRPNIRLGCDDAATATYFRAGQQGGVGKGAAALPLYDRAGLARALAVGALDAAIALDLPTTVGITRLPPDAESEHATFRATRVFPIFRVLCLQGALAARHRWLAGALYDAFLRAKQNSLDRLIFAGMSRYPLPWINAYVMRMRGVFGDDFWPYGVAANRPTLDAFCAHAGPQGLPPFTGGIDSLFDAAGTLPSD